MTSQLTHHHVASATNLNLPLVLVLSADSVTQPLEYWQAIITQTGLALAPTSTIEWDWVNPELGAVTIDSLRELVGRLSFGVGPTLHRFVVVLAADQAPAQAQNALLKSLEEPPERTTLILAVTNPSALLETVLSRCRVVRVSEIAATSNNSNAHPVSISAPTTDATENLSTAVATLIQFSQNPTAFSHSQLIQLASQFKDRVSAQTLLRQWLSQLHRQSAALTPPQIKLAQATLVALAQLDQNLSPSLVLEQTWFDIL